MPAQPEGIHLMIGRRPTLRSATRLSTGTCWSSRPRGGAAMILLHDDAKREYVHRPRAYSAFARLIRKRPVAKAQRLDQLPANGSIVSSPGPAVSSTRAFQAPPPPKG